MLRGALPSASMAATIFISCLLVSLNLRGLKAVEIGVYWGTASSQPLPPQKVVAGLLQANNIARVMLPDADPLILQSLSGTGIAVAVGIPNEMLGALNASRKTAESWVHDNVTRYVSGNAGAGVVRIEYIAVGDEPFLSSHADKYAPFVVGAVTNIRLALTAASLATKVKVVVPCSTDVIHMNSSLPSSSRFRVDLNRTMGQLLSFLKDQGSPFVVNLYPFVVVQESQNFTLEQALFRSSRRPLHDGGKIYNDLFSIAVDSLASSLTKAGYDKTEIIVGKIGWPTDGAPEATMVNALTFMNGLVNRLRDGEGTPLRPKRPPAEVYILSLLDEDQFSSVSGGFNRHWGVFTFDGQAKYNVDLGQGSKPLVGAADVDYLPLRWCVVDNNKYLVNISAAGVAACAAADCSALSVGGSCSNLTWPANVSYAFNNYYQQRGQSAESCDFAGMGLITTVDPSDGECRFAVGIRASSSRSSSSSLIMLLCFSFLMAAHLLLC